MLSELALLSSPLRAFAEAHRGNVSACALLAVFALREGAASASAWMPYVKGVLEPALSEAAELPCTWPADSKRLQRLSEEGRRKAAQLRAQLLAQHAALFPAAFEAHGAQLAPEGVDAAGHPHADTDVPSPSVYEAAGFADPETAAAADRRAALEALYSAEAFVAMCAVLIARGIERTVRAAPPRAPGSAATKGGGDDLACVPHFDLCNYAASPREGLQLRFDSARYRVLCTAKEALAEGDELLYHYGKKEREDFLQNYGFVPDTPGHPGEAIV